MSVYKKVFLIQLMLNLRIINKNQFEFIYYKYKYKHMKMLSQCVYYDLYGDICTMVS